MSHEAEIDKQKVQTIPKGWSGPLRPEIDTQQDQTLPHSFSSSLPRGPKRSWWGPLESKHFLFVKFGPQGTFWLQLLGIVLFSIC